MDRIKSFIREYRFFIVVSMAALIVAFLPLFTVNCINGHDIEYHLLRIDALKEGILAGKPFLKINMLYFGGRGYASSLFYPDTLLYIPALLRCLGVSINLSYHIFVAITIILCFASMGYVTYLITKNPYASVGAAVFYILAQYHIDDIYTRSAVGEYTAMIFLPFVIYGLYDMLYNHMQRPYIMVIGYVGVLLCHTNTTVFVIGLYLLCFVIALPSLCKNKKDFMLLIVSAIIVLGVTAFYYVPVLEQFLSASFNTDSGGFVLSHEQLSFRDLFLNKNTALGIALPLLCLSRVIVFNQNNELKKRGNILRFADLCLALGVFFALLTTGIVPWNRLQGILGFVQFPWRLLIVVTPLLSMAAAIYGVHIHVRHDIVMALFIAVMIVSAVGNIERIDEGYYSYSDDYYDYVEYTGNVIGGEWLPKSVTNRETLTKDCDIAIGESGSSYIVSRNKNIIELEVAGEEYVDVPFIYYKGYLARTATGQKLVLNGEGENGSVRVFLPAGSDSEHISVYYNGTLAQKLSGIVSLLFMIISIILGIKCCKRRKQSL